MSWWIQRKQSSKTKDGNEERCKTEEIICEPNKSTIIEVTVDYY